MDKPYTETARDIYVRAAAAFYAAATTADYETADPAALIARGRAVETMAHETWPLTTRQARSLAGARARAELNTPEGRAFRDRIVEKLNEQ